MTVSEHNIRDASDTSMEMPCGEAEVTAESCEKTTITPQAASGVLPTNTKTRVQSANLDELAQQLESNDSDLSNTLTNLRKASQVDRETMNLQMQL